LKILQKTFYTFFTLTNFLFSQEYIVSEISLKGLITDRKQEISGMDWYGDNLILLPENQGGHLFSIPKSEIFQRLDGDTTRIHPKKILFNTPDYQSTLPGFDSFESIVFKGNQVFITIEIRFKDAMGAFLVKGKIDPNTLNITVPKQTLVELPIPIFADNMSFEASLLHKKNIISFFEANGKNVVESPKAASYSIRNNTVTTMPMPTLEYRISDASQTDWRNRFWVINYFYFRDKEVLKPENDQLIIQYEEGETHKKYTGVERLVELQVRGNKIVRTNKPPIQLQLVDEKTSRKWEALARLDDKGFLLATDKYPRMILGFVPVN